MTTTPSTSLRILIVDDDSIRHDQFIKNNPDCQIDSAYTVSDAMALFDQGNYDMVSLDHDLGPDSDIMPFVKHMRDNLKSSDNYMLMVHSANPVGAANILSYFSRTGVICNKIHYGWRVGNLFKVLLQGE